MKIRTGDKVKILAGKDKGKTGKVLQVLIDKRKVVVEEINLLIKHQRPKKQGEKGQRVQFSAPLDISNVALVCPKCNKSTRVNFKITKMDKAEKDAKKSEKSRVCRKCNEIIN